MNDENPKYCTNCGSINIIEHNWGRTQFFSCKDCKKEVIKPKIVESELWSLPNAYWSYDDGVD